MNRCNVTKQQGLGCGVGRGNHKPSVTARMFLTSQGPPHITWMRRIGLAQGGQPGWGQSQSHQVSPWQQGRAKVKVGSQSVGQALEQPSAQCTAAGALGTKTPLAWPRQALRVQQGAARWGWSGLHSGASHPGYSPHSPLTSGWAVPCTRSTLCWSQN